MKPYESETVKALLARREQRRRQRVFRIFSNLICVIGLTGCGIGLVALEMEDQEIQKVQEQPVIVAEVPQKDVIVPARDLTVERFTDPVVEAPEDISLGEFKITHFCACTECCGKAEDDPWYGITATGTRVEEGRTIAVDPKVIPYGTEVTICYADGTEHTYTAEDCGGAIKGNRIDVYMDSHEEALVEGVKYGEVYIKEVSE
jgi:3D (Asp-Asp-Asp) domain-containing protein